MVFALITSGKTDIEAWTETLSKAGIPYDVIDISLHDWMERCLSKAYDIFILRAPGMTDIEKQMFDERAAILAHELGLRIYPSLTEILIYENKKYLSYWLKAHGVSSPRTDVFYHKADALRFINKAAYPIVGKMNIGASGKGVKIIQNQAEAVQYVNKVFGKGIRPRIGPNLRTASLLTKIKNGIYKKGLLKKKLSAYATVYKQPQRYAILQEYIPHQYEWRTVRIGESYFAHKKLVEGNKASGSLKKDYGNPPLRLLDFVKQTCEKLEITSASLDIFETSDGFLVNEIQTYFGQSDKYQMQVDGVAGRYRSVDGKWVFEAGDYASNQCYDLRLEHILSLLKEKAAEAPVGNESLA